MTKEQLEQRYQEYNQEQLALSADIQKKSAQVQQLEGKKLLLQELHEAIVKAEGKIVALPDPDDPPQDQTPAS